MWSPLGDELSDKAHWVSEPNTRGTYGVISSCVLTLVLCLWTVQRPGVPRNQASKKMLPNKLYWLGVAFFFPDVFAGVAFNELREARQLTKDMEEALGNLNPKPKTDDLAWYTRLLRLRKREPGPEQRKNQWTIKHSYFTIMGGFAFDNSNEPGQCPMPFDTNYIVLSSQAMLLLAKLEPELIPDISKEEIDDKNKTDSFATLLACVQALWFCLQIIARMAQSLAVTLLELNTLAHAVCALIVYGFWWHKPMDISRRTIIPVAERTGSPKNNTKIRRAAALCQAMCVGCPYGRFKCWAEDEDEGQASSSEGGIDLGSEPGLPYYTASWAGALPTENEWQEKNHLHRYSLANFSQSEALRPVGAFYDDASWIMAQFEDRVKKREQRRANDSGISADVKGDPTRSFGETTRTGTPDASNTPSTSDAPSLPSVSRDRTINEDGHCAIKINSLEFGFNGDGFMCRPKMVLKATVLDIVPVPFWWFMVPVIVTVPAKYLSRPQRLVDDLAEHLSVEELRMILEAGPGFDYCGVAHTWDNIKACKKKHVAETSLIQSDMQSGATLYLMHSGASQVCSSGFVVSGCGLLYSVFHFLVWEGPFRTNTEKILWRVATAYIAFAPIMTGISYLWMLLDSAQKDRVEAIRRYTQRVLMSIERAKTKRDLERSRLRKAYLFFIGRTLPSIWCSLLFLLMAFISFTTFVWQSNSIILICRLLLVVESLVGLAYLPDSAFELPDLSIYFPHLM